MKTFPSMGMAMNFFIAFSLLAAVASAQNECKPKLFDQDSVACVCDEDYCDSADPDPPSEGQYLLVTTNKDGLRFSPTYGNLTEPEDDYDCSNLLNKRAAIFNINVTDSAQTILGYGGAFTDAVGINLNNVTEKLVDVFFNTYFTKAGLNYNMGRTHIGHCDFSAERYFYTSDEDDYSMSSWSLQHQDRELRIPYLKKAKSLVDDLLLTVNIWTSPRWLRGPNDVGVNARVLEEHWDSFCLYIMKYLEAFRDEGIEFWSVGYSNEPVVTIAGVASVEDDPLFPVWALNKLAEFAVQYFGPALKERQFNNTKILFLDDSRDIINRIPLNAFLRIEGIRPLLELIGMHSYKNDIVNPSVVDQAHDLLPNVTLISTEMCILRGVNLPNLGAWSTAEYYIQNFIQEMNHYFSAWTDWNLCLNMAGGPRFRGTGLDAPIIIDTENNVFYKQPSYYAIGQFSKFIPKGSTKVSIVSEYPTDVQSTAALRPDGLVAAVLFNKSNNTVDVKLTKGGQHIRLDLTPNSINTVLF